MTPKKEATWCSIITLANVDRFSKFFHQLIREKILYVHTQTYSSPAICCYTTMWNSKVTKICYGFWQHPQQTADIAWLTNILRFVRWRLESTVERCSVERCCVMVIYSLRLSSHCLRSFYAILYVLYTHLGPKCYGPYGLFWQPALVRYSSILYLCVYWSGK